MFSHMHKLEKKGIKEGSHENKRQNSRIEEGDQGGWGK